MTRKLKRTPKSSVYKGEPLKNDLICMKICSVGIMATFGIHAPNAVAFRKLVGGRLVLNRAGLYWVTRPYTGINGVDICRVLQTAPYVGPGRGGNVNSGPHNVYPPPVLQ